MIRDNTAIRQNRTLPGSLEKRRPMILSDRLSAAASMVTHGFRLADIGTDHGFVPIWLVRNSVIPSAIAMDINRGPLERAKEHITQAGLEGYIQTRLSDGLAGLREGEADSILIAGMGGALTVRILEKDPPNSLGVSELILQPQSKISKVREYLCMSGWRIDAEDMVLEDGKYYPMMHCVRGEMTLTPQEAEFGPCLIESGHPVLMRYLAFREKTLSANLESLKKSDSDRAQARKEQILQQIMKIRCLRQNAAGNGS